MHALAVYLIVPIHPVAHFHPSAASAAHFSVRINLLVHPNTHPETIIANQCNAGIQSSGRPVEPGVAMLTFRIIMYTHAHTKVQRATETCSIRTRVHANSGRPRVLNNSRHNCNSRAPIGSCPTESCTTAHAHNMRPTRRPTATDNEQSAWPPDMRTLPEKKTQHHGGAIRITNCA